MSSLIEYSHVKMIFLGDEGRIVVWQINVRVLYSMCMWYQQKGEKVLSYTC